MIEIESKELKNLQKQIDDLAKNISRKETVINEINDEMEIEQSSMIEEDVSLEENVAEIEQRCEAETIKKATLKYAHKCLIQVEELEAEISKIRKNAANLGSTLKIKSNNFCEKLDEIEVKEELCEDVLEKVLNLREYLSFSDKKPDKERNLKSILTCKKYLKGYLKYPKRPSQIPISDCCKVCILSSKVLTIVKD